MKGLTKKQKEILDFLISFSAEKGYSPSYRDVQEAFGFSSPASSFKHIKSLEQKGLIEKQEGKWRSFKQKKDEHAENTLQNTLAQQASVQNNESESIPIIGAIAQGKKIELFSQVSTISIPLSLIKKTHLSSCYAFLAKDSSFLHASILEGDIIALELKQKAAEGELMLVTKNELAYIGRFRQENNLIYIDDLPFQEKEIRIRGALLTLVRSFL